MPMQHRGFPGGDTDKEPACQLSRRERCRFDPWVGKVPWRRAWQPTPVFLPENPTDRGACWATKSRTRPRQLTYSLSTVPWLAASSPSDVSSAFSSRKPLLITNPSNVSPPPPHPSSTPELVLNSDLCGSQRLGLPEFHLQGRLLKGSLLIRSFPARPGNLEPIFYF